MDLAMLAGMTSTALFAAANLPMLAKAIRTRDMTSYSLSALVVSNAANVVHTVYVASLPMGPIWVLHAFYLVTMAMMIALYLRHGRSTDGRDRAVGRGVPARASEPGHGRCRRLRRGCRAPELAFRHA